MNPYKNYLAKKKERTTNKKKMHTEPIDIQFASKVQVSSTTTVKSPSLPKTGANFCATSCCDMILPKQRTVQAEGIATNAR